MFAVASCRSSQSDRSTVSKAEPVIQSESSGAQDVKEQSNAPSTVRSESTKEAIAESESRFTELSAKFGLSPADRSGMKVATKPPAEDDYEAFRRKRRDRKAALSE